MTRKDYDCILCKKFIKHIHDENRGSNGHLYRCHVWVCDGVGCVLPFSFCDCDVKDLVPKEVLEDGKIPIIKR